jgi:hypothetical protein
MKFALNKEFFISKESMFAFEEGYYAFSRGWLVCKYNPETLKGKEWQRGFDCAYFDNLKKVQSNAGKRNA